MPPIIRVSVNGHDQSFLIDTNSTFSVVDSTLVATSSIVNHRKIQTDGSVITLPTIVAPSIAIGGTRCNWIQEIGSLRLVHFRKLAGKDFYGILGMDILRRFVIQLDFDNRRATMSNVVMPQIECGPSLKMRFDDMGCPCINVSTPDGKLDSFHIDTGMTGTGSLKAEVFDSLLGGRFYRINWRPKCCHCHGQVCNQGGAGSLHRATSGHGFV